MGKKIHNPPPPTGMVRPTPPPSPPRVPRWQDDIDEVKRLTAALGQLTSRLAEAEAALVVHDPVYQDEYWKRHPVDLLPAGYRLPKDEKPPCPHCGAVVQYTKLVIHAEGCPQIDGDKSA